MMNDEIEKKIIFFLKKVDPSLSKLAHQIYNLVVRLR